jgi:predicted lipoprotein with Yx(FWY)xxD motif
LKTTQIQKEREMKAKYVMLSAIVGLALLVSACSPQATAAPTNVPPPTQAPAATEAPAAVPVTGNAVVNLEQNDSLGSVLVDDKGMTLYLFTKDTPNTSVCYDKCATAWPPLLTGDKPSAGEGVDASLLGTTTRKDGSTQVTYNGWPLYYYEKDKAPGDVTGQDVGGVWFVLSAAGDKVESAAATEAPAASTGAATLSLGKNDQLGSFLVDDKGMTLYLFTKDTPNTSVCYDKCATAWPPLLTTGEPVTGEGADASLLGTTKRTDGSVQVTYNGWPLYYYEKDKAAGDVTGQDVGGVWFVVSAEGDKVESTAAATEAPAASAGAATVSLGKNDKLGSFLVDDKGMSLYLFTKDTPNTSVCYDKCATAWPPLLTTGDPVAGDGVNASLLGTTKRKDGSVQVTYNGWPLYYYEKDKAAGDVTGQDVGGVWYVLSAAGDQVKTP